MKPQRKRTSKRPFLKLNIAADSGQKIFNTWQIGVGFLQSGKHTQALHLFESIIKLCPGEVTGYMWRGHCYLDMKRYPAAAIDYRRSVKLAPKYVFGYPRLCLAKAYSKMGKYHLALAEYKSFMSEGPWPRNTREKFYGDTHKISFYSECLAPLLKRMGKAREALWACEKALKYTHGDKKITRSIKRRIAKMIPKNTNSSPPRWATFLTLTKGVL
ncbi:MAG: hypothetical protein A2117_01445 [Candidatus Wildermuthbacteria bacterium GWA2_46_15]|uniref:Uncharacterized protein n=1 Tax=Candidatus Wildermuthbacteria bacterium GWA2_46_15 TaxID=1802443 RepID=A0A1G2QQ64_9BACT|nr:MAG: hypothetical protein A2117_01445 [Candidatus Wildermuthbacteria bacterium GWA2_46_15]